MCWNKRVASNAAQKGVNSSGFFCSPAAEFPRRPRSVSLSYSERSGASSPRRVPCLSARAVCVIAGNYHCRGQSAASAKIRPVLFPPCACALGGTERGRRLPVPMGQIRFLEKALFAVEVLGKLFTPGAGGERVRMCRASLAQRVGSHL